MKGDLRGMIGERPYVNRCQASMFVQKSCSGNFEGTEVGTFFRLVDSLLQALP